MRKALTRFTATFWLELRLIVVQWSFLLLQVVWAGLVIANFTNNPFSSSADMVLMSLALFIVPLATLVAMVIAALSASRAKRTRFALLEAAYPTGAEIVLGRWLATLVAMLSFLIVPIGFALVVGPLDAFFKVLPIFLLETLTMLAFVCGVIWLIQVTIGVRRWMYPLFAVVWLGSGFVSSMNIFLVPFSPLLSFISLGWNYFSYSETWGRLTIGDLPLFYDLFYAGLVLLLLGAIVWRYDFKRFYRQPKMAVALTGGALALTVVAFIAYTGINIGITNQSRERDQFAMENMDSFVLPDEVPYYVSDYDVTLDLADSANPQFRAQMQVVNSGDEPLTQLDFSLIDQLEITESSIPFEREQDFVRFTLPEPLAPGESLPLDLNYQGALWYFSGSMLANRLREPQSFIRSGGVDLSCASVWYPVPGRVLVGRDAIWTMSMEAVSITRSVPDCVAAEPAAFSLRVENPGQLHFASNLPEVGENTFGAETATWASLIGAPSLVIEPVGDITLVANTRSLNSVRPLVEAYYQPAVDYLGEIFPDVSGVILTMLDGVEQSTIDQVATPMVDGRLVTSLRSARDLQTFPINQYAEYTYAGRELINSLFGQGGPYYYSNYMEDIAMFLWAHYKTGGDIEQMRTILTDGFPMGNTGVQTYFHGEPGTRWPIARQLLGIYEAQGEAVVMDVLREMRAETETLNTLSEDEIRAWIEERANAD